jgi:hypothetical protein
MEPQRPGSRHNRMIADTSDISAFSTAQRRHADDLAAAAADLTAATVAADAFGEVGADFLAALNRAIVIESHRVAQLAERLVAGMSTTGAAAEAYRTAEGVAARSISALGA